MQLSAFIEALGATSQSDVVKAILYYHEHLHPGAGLTPKQLEEAFREARQAVPSNIHQVLAILRQRKLVSRAKDGTYMLTAHGRRAIETAMEGRRLRLLDERAVTVQQLSRAFHDRVLRMADPDERRYVEEALRCLQPPVMAFRAAILMGWTAAVYHLRKMIERRGFAAFNNEARRLYPRSRLRPVHHLRDLEDYPDKILLEVCEGMGLYDRAVKHRLQHWLDLRNGCAHPTELAPEEHVARAFFEEVLEYVLTKQ